ncbi:MAG: hypothetical protein AAF456_02650 [Planctomycetota bacterium]
MTSLQIPSIPAHHHMRWKCSSSSWAFVVALVTLLFLVGPTSDVAAATHNSSLRKSELRPHKIHPCKYSVRDVAFVDLNPYQWQLHFQASSSPTEEQKNMLRDRLDRSNVSYLWSDDREGQDSTEANPGEGSMPLISLRRGDLTTDISADFSDDDSLDQILDALLISDKRTEILSTCCDSLCVMVLVESGDAERDSHAAAAAAEAVTRIENSMWTLEKPTEKGAALIVVSDLEAEKWLLHSLQIDQDALPAVAIVFGRGVRLGDVMTDELITPDRLSALAAICGRDCECDLDPDWLYGPSLVHVWNLDNERSAENSLTFDPNSALVIAEVSQILNKNARRGSGVPPELDLGSGLVIHDLGPPSQNAAAIESADELEAGRAEAAGEVITLDETEQKDPESTGIEPAPGRLTSDAPDQSTAVIPWTTLGGLLAAFLIVAAAVILMKKNG